jgi:hypothetical protein
MVSGVGGAYLFLWFTSPRTTEDWAIVAIDHCGGKITRDKMAQDKPVVAVSFEVVRVGFDRKNHDVPRRLTDKDLADLRPQLEALHALRDLDLSGAEITDEGLQHLKGLTQLKTLQLAGTEITDKGLQHLKCLTELKKLELANYLEPNWKLTRSGVEELQKALPHTKIIFDRFDRLGPLDFRDFILDKPKQ